MGFHALAAGPAPLEFMLAQWSQRAAELDPAFVLYFASAELDPREVAVGIARCFPTARTMGCSAHAEFTNAGFTEGGLSAMVFERDVIDEVHLAAVEDLPRDIPRRVEAACAALTRQAGAGALLAPDDYVGLILMDGLTASEEAVMERLGDLSTVSFVGGSAADCWTFDRTWVAVDGVARARTGLLALLRPTRPWAVGKTQSWQVWDGEVLTPTKVDLAHRLVHEFDGRPALSRYADLLGYTPENLDFAYCRQHHPVGLLAGGELFVRQPSRALPDGTMEFFCRLHAGQPLRILSSTPIVSDTADRLGTLREELGGELGCVLDFLCVQRHYMLEKSRRLDDYANLFPRTPRAGFSTYGEQWLGHMNCTSTLIAFGS